MNPRANAVTAATSHQPVRLHGDRAPPLSSAQYAQHVFTLDTIKHRVSQDVYERLCAVIDQGGQLDADLADHIAQAAKTWALSLGATHFTHWFQPMTGSTAEKHDAFLSLDRAGVAVERFSGEQLIQSEPDASSFPSGGMRSTFEARGYTAWDPSSPMFLMANDNGLTLCVPSVFISYHGDALDKKTPLLRSMEALNTQAVTLLARLGEKVSRVVPTLGCEQEYFLIDKAWYALRPDLVLTGRTLLGARPPKGQSLEDHYFGAIPQRVQAFMIAVEEALYQLGVPAKTRHNEVAPSQFELAVIFGDANVAVDQNQLVMEVLRRTAPKHHFQVLLHEKPFAGINGSGKHNNWSLRDDAGRNLLDPGSTPHQNLRFLGVLASVLLGFARHAPAIRASIATYQNDFRLGANEAPPAIMSVFLGDLLSQICTTLANERPQEGAAMGRQPEQALITLGVSKLPRVAKDNTDRNRTSPFAFTGNKFELRAVGSSQNSAFPVTALNTAVADGMRQIVAWIDGSSAQGDEAAFFAIQRAVREAIPVIFEGNGYGQAWAEEAARRGLRNDRNTPDALLALQEPAVEALYAQHAVYTSAELAATSAVLREQYVLMAGIEAETLIDLVATQILPAALAERAELAEGLLRLMELGARGVVVDDGVEREALHTLSLWIGDLQRGMDALRAALSGVHHAADPATHCARLLLPAMASVRSAADGLEGVVSDHRWPLPKYREMLFLNS